MLNIRHHLSLKHAILIHIHVQEGNTNPALKSDFYIFSLIFSTQMNVSYYNANPTFEGHNVAYQCKGLDQSNSVCEYEVNLSTNEKVITEKQNINTNC